MQSLTLFTLRSTAAPVRDIDKNQPLDNTLLLLQPMFYVYHLEDRELTCILEYCSSSEDIVEC